MLSRHTHARSAERRSLLLVLVISSVFLGVEVLGGILGSSLAFLADAGHLLTDVVAIGVALMAFWIAGRVGGEMRTYGYARAEIMAGLLNGFGLLLISLFIGFEGVRRITATPDVDGPLVLGVAFLGLLASVAAVAILYRSAKKNLNVRGVFLHLVGDGVSSVAVIVSALIILLTGWNLVDPMAAIFISVVIVFAAVRLIMATVDVLMEVAPRGVSLPDVRTAMLREPGVQSVHDVHVWTLTSGCVAMSAHVVTAPGTDYSTLLLTLRERLKRGFDVGHLTLQIEDASLPDEDVHFGGDPRCLA